MAVTESGHLASREIDDLYRSARSGGLPVRIRRPRQPRRRRGRHADDLPERVPIPRAWRAASQAGQLAAHDREQRDQAALPTGAIEAAPGRARRSNRSMPERTRTTTRHPASVSSSPRCPRFRRSSGRRSSCANSRAARTAEIAAILGVTIIGNKDGRVAEERARQGNALPLAA